MNTIRPTHKGLVEKIEKYVDQLEPVKDPGKKTVQQKLTDFSYQLHKNAARDLTPQ